MRELARHFTDVCYRATAGASDITGNPSYGTPKAFRGRVVHRARRVVSQAGEEVTSMTQVQTFEPVTTSDWIWLPGADTSSLSAGQQPITVQSARALAGGVTVYEVML